MASKMYTFFSTKKDNFSLVWPSKYQLILQPCHTAFGNASENSKSKITTAFTFSSGESRSIRNSSNQLIRGTPPLTAGSSPIRWYTAQCSGLPIILAWLKLQPLPQICTSGRCCQHFVVNAVLTLRLGNVALQSSGCAEWYRGGNAGTSITHPGFLMDSGNN